MENIVNTTMMQRGQKRAALKMLRAALLRVFTRPSVLITARARSGMAPTALLIASVFANSQVAQAAPHLPGQAAPAGFASADPPGGGRIMYGSLPPASGEGDAFRSGLRTADGYFGRSLTLVGAVHSAPNASGPPSIIGLFRATLRGVAVGGLAITSVDPQGGPRLALLFDDAQRANSSLPGLMEALRSIGTGGRAQTRAPLHTITAQDNTVSISIPADWTTGRLAEGEYLVRGPDQAAVYSIAQVVELGGRAVVPGTPALPYIADPARAFIAVQQAQAQVRGDADPQIHLDTVKALPDPPNMPPGTKGTLVGGTTILKSVTRRFMGVVWVTPPTNQLAWLLHLDRFISAPADRFAADRSMMLTILNSSRFNGKAYQVTVWKHLKEMDDTTNKMLQQSAQWRADQQAKFQASMNSARAAQDSIDRSTAGFVHYLNDSAVLNMEPTGVHRTLSAATAESFVKADPQHFSIVPLNQYRKGVDY
ncbi:MAG: hypothetical protein M3169_09390 [Candidatus Eremiobacteraeota bacterium]|nr:hypothetical protein [Candidatus Eremiobacteraeota bacterium]